MNDPAKTRVTTCRRCNRVMSIGESVMNLSGIDEDDHAWPLNIIPNDFLCQGCAFEVLEKAVKQQRERLQEARR